MSHAVGAVIAGKYRLERLLGEGGMGSVWRAMNVHLEVPVAIKLLRAGLSSNELSERLRIEARAAARLVHPSIVRVFDIGEAQPGEPFIVMELLAGESLSDRIHRERPSPVECVQLLLPIAEALALAHSAGVVHRDLKPDNIFLCPDGDFTRPKLLDFGIAKVIDGAPMTNITQRGTLVGSPAYMSPEQAKGSDDVDFRTDIWSFCVVLYEAMSGKLPFGAADGVALLRAIVQDPPFSLLTLPGVDARLWSLLEQGLSKNAEQRPTSMTELGRELATWLRQHGVEQDGTGTPLESKWLPRTVRPPAQPEIVYALSHARTESAHSTLESVTKSERGHIDSSVDFKRGNKSSAPIAITLSLGLAALVGSFAWARGVFDGAAPTQAASVAQVTPPTVVPPPELPPPVTAASAATPSAPEAPPAPAAAAPRTPGETPSPVTAASAAAAMTGSPETPAPVEPEVAPTAPAPTSALSAIKPGPVPPTYRRPRPAKAASPAPEATPYPQPVAPVFSSPEPRPTEAPRPAKPAPPPPPSTPSDLMDPY